MNFEIFSCEEYPYICFGQLIPMTMELETGFDIV